MRTLIPSAHDIPETWFEVDAQGQHLGRLASRVARVLMGKDSPLYTPFLDMRVHVIVFNAEKIVISGNKAKEKVYHRYTGFPGGLRSLPYRDRMSQKPEEVFRDAVRRMLPKNRLGRKTERKLHVYGGSWHPHSAQTPLPLNFGTADKDSVPPVYRRELLDWLVERSKLLSDADRARPAVCCGDREYTMPQLVEEVEQQTAFGRDFIRTMYKWQSSRKKAVKVA